MKRHLFPAFVLAVATVSLAQPAQSAAQDRSPANEPSAHSAANFSTTSTATIEPSIESSTHDGKYGGNASCKIECHGPNGTQCRYTNCNVAFIYENEFSAKNALRLKLDGMAAAENGRIISGSISFSIEVKFDQQKTSPSAGNDSGESRDEVCASHDDSPDKAAFTFSVRAGDVWISSPYERSAWVKVRRRTPGTTGGMYWTFSFGPLDERQLSSEYADDGRKFIYLVEETRWDKNMSPRADTVKSVEIADDFSGNPSTLQGGCTLNGVNFGAGAYACINGRTYCCRGGEWHYYRSGCDESDESFTGPSEFGDKDAVEFVHINWSHLSGGGARVWAQTVVNEHLTQKIAVAVEWRNDKDPFNPIRRQVTVDPGKSRYINSFMFKGEATLKEAAFAQ